MFLGETWLGCTTAIAEKKTLPRGWGWWGFSRVHGIWKKLIKSGRDRPKKNNHDRNCHWAANIGSKPMQNTIVQSVWLIIRRSCATILWSHLWTSWKLLWYELARIIGWDLRLQLQAAGVVSMDLRFCVRKIGNPATTFCTEVAGFCWGMICSMWWSGVTQQQPRPLNMSCLILWAPSGHWLRDHKFARRSWDHMHVGNLRATC